MNSPTDTLKRAILIVEDLTGSGLTPYEQFNVLDLAQRALGAVHWTPPQPAVAAPEPVLRGKNVRAQ